MAGTNAMICVPIEAGADLSALQFTAVKMGTGRKVVSATANTDTIIGVLMNKPVSGQASEVCIAGVAKGIAGGAISAGDKLTATTGGKFIATTTDKDRIIGYAGDAASTNDVFPIHVSPGMVSV